MSYDLIRLAGCCGIELPHNLSELWTLGGDVKSSKSIMSSLEQYLRDIMAKLRSRLELQYPEIKTPKPIILVRMIHMSYEFMSI
jgi:hypothetical protein